MTDRSRMTIPPPRPGFFTGEPLGDARPTLYALLAVEFEPGKIVYYHLELDRWPGACTINVDRDTLDVAYEPGLERTLYAPCHVEATISGTVVSQDPGYRRPTHAESTATPRTLTTGDPA